MIFLWPIRKNVNAVAVGSLFTAIHSTMTTKNRYLSIFIWWDSTKSSIFAAKIWCYEHHIVLRRGLKGNQV